MPNNDRLLIQILLLALLGAGLWVMAPFISALLWGAILAFASWPLMRLLTRVLGGRETLAASLLTAVWITVVALPLVWLGFNLADHIRDATAFIRDVQVDGLPDAPDWLGSIPWWGATGALVGFHGSTGRGLAGLGQAAPGAGRQLASGAQCADWQRRVGADPEPGVRVLLLP